MIKITYIYKSKIDGNYYEADKYFNDPYKALRFLYKAKKFAYNIEWACDNPEDHEYLYYHFKP